MGKKSRKIILKDEDIRDAIITTACNQFVEGKLDAHGLLAVVLCSCKGLDALQRLAFGKVKKK
jgi:hypothetical protein